MADEFTAQVFTSQMSLKSLRSKIGIGATNELSFRVSVATLVRVLFENPDDGELMLALEHKATLLENEAMLPGRRLSRLGAIRIHGLKTSKTHRRFSLTVNSRVPNRTFAYLYAHRIGGGSAVLLAIFCRE
jgi:hypothetical protein